MAQLRLVSLSALLLVTLLPACAVIDLASGVDEARQLQKIGIPAKATILKLWDTGITINNDPVIGLEVEVAPEGRSPYVATIKRSLISRLDVPQFQPRSVIPVRFDPNNPERVAIDVYKYR